MSFVDPRFLQGFYFFVTGIWPLLHMPSFIFVTGPKHDLWLVRTVALMITAIGATLLCSWVFSEEVFFSLYILAIGSSLALGFIDIYYSLRRVIRLIYLLDAVAQVFLIIWWLVYRPF